METKPFFLVGFLYLVAIAIPPAPLTRWPEPDVYILDVRDKKKRPRPILVAIEMAGLCVRACVCGGTLLLAASLSVCVIADVSRSYKFSLNIRYHHE